METQFQQYKMCFHDNSKYVSMKSEFSVGQKWIQNWSTVGGGEKGHKYFLPTPLAGGQEKSFAHHFVQHYLPPFYELFVHFQLGQLVGGAPHLTP